ncbi:DUF5067 domain-containing protein [Enterococcus malodoratus]|uniref:DUF5067 domain-containing protein n=1 Tax=Enterococcus malodoratus ATCC 43197 TaxID=1158601 RepID=R2QSK8_9ENTE|nr:DUF5067 domain-containing protein [Enterococcus malodoratus]EOH71581.1 hypothetical protein UAI_04537 [Enterococcus malodoratus ATCC 43197]EOT69729.1 hypothetical protein I585_01196 [Enterococcus malodoratus ATCC 43197]OJG63898.1 hypothetical protein RV07_GL000781 [Enterococcus malodoratus]SPX01368.1 Uncharacterised protein [Enterococcus malodoratus]STC70918.1 Uncharacterised protein [Enterococcus malodoratus]
MKKIVLSCAILISLVGLGACGSSNNSSDTKHVKSSATATSETKKKDGTYENRTLTVPNGVLKITGFQKGTDYDGNSMFYVLFDLTNNSNEAKNVQTMYMGMVQASQNTGDTTEKLEFSVTMDSPVQEKLDMLQKDINPGGTIQGAYAYNFADESKPVTFTFTDELFSMNDPIATEDITIQ